MTFLLVWDKDTQGVSLWYFHACMCYTHNWFISSNYIHSSLVPFLWWLKFHRRTILLHYLQIKTMVVLSLEFFLGLLINYISARVSSGAASQKIYQVHTKWTH
jgi:hypothetical protein